MPSPTTGNRPAAPVGWLRGTRARLRQRSSAVRGRWRGPAGRRQDGASTVELVLLVPVVLLATLLPVQAGLAWHAKQVLVAAAQEGTRAARPADLSDGQAQQLGAAQARAFAAQAGGKAVNVTGVRVTRGPEQVQLQVTGQALAVLPIFKISVSGQAVSPVERFVAP